MKSFLEKFKLERPENLTERMQDIVGFFTLRHAVYIKNGNAIDKAYSCALADTETWMGMTSERRRFTHPTASAFKNITEGLKKQRKSLKARDGYDTWARTHTLSTPRRAKPKVKALKTKHKQNMNELKAAMGRVTPAEIMDRKPAPGSFSMVNPADFPPGMSQLEMIKATQAKQGAEKIKAALEKRRVFWRRHKMQKIKAEQNAIEAEAREQRSAHRWNLLNWRRR